MHTSTNALVIGTLSDDEGLDTQAWSIESKTWMTASMSSYQCLVCVSHRQSVEKKGTLKKLPCRRSRPHERLSDA